MHSTQTLIIITKAKKLIDLYLYNVYLIDYY